MKKLEQKFVNNYKTTSKVIQKSLPFSQDVLRMHLENEEVKKESKNVEKVLERHDSNPKPILKNEEKPPKISTPLSKQARNVVCRLNEE